MFEELVKAFFETLQKYKREHIQESLHRKFDDLLRSQSKYKTNIKLYARALCVVALELTNVEWKDPSGRALVLGLAKPDGDRSYSVLLQEVEKFEAAIKEATKGDWENVDNEDGQYFSHALDLEERLANLAEQRKLEVTHFKRIQAEKDALPTPDQSPQSSGPLGHIKTIPPERFYGSSQPAASGFQMQLMHWSKGAESSSPSPLQTCSTNSNATTATLSSSIFQSAPPTQPAQPDYSQLIALVRQILAACADAAESAINADLKGKMFEGSKPDRAWCQEMRNATQTNAMWLGTVKEVSAEKCSEDKFSEKEIVSQCTIEATYEYKAPPPKFLGKKVIETNTIRPDVVVHLPNNPEKVLAVFDFKFPCPDTNTAQWGQREGVSQDQRYRTALGVDPQLISPKSQ